MTSVDDFSRTVGAPRRARSVNAGARLEPNAIRSSGAREGIHIRAPARSASRGIAGGGRLERHGPGIFETASSETSASNKASARRRTRRGFPCRERMAATRWRCRQSVEAAAGSPSRESAERQRRRAVRAERHSLLGRSRGLGKSTIARDPFGQPLMLPVKDLLVASLLIPLTCTHSLGDSRPLSLPSERTASGPRAGAARVARDCRRRPT
jgi:hypothetical protein